MQSPAAPLGGGGGGGGGGVVSVVVSVAGEVVASSRLLSSVVSTFWIVLPRCASVSGAVWTKQPVVETATTSAMANERSDFEQSFMVDSRA